MANVYFSRKIACDELFETFFFATGEVPKKEKSKDFTTLTTDMFKAKIFSSYRIEVNSVKCKSIHDVKMYVQEKLR